MTETTIAILLGFLGWFSYNHYEDYKKYYWYLITTLIISYAIITIHPLILSNIERNIVNSIEIKGSQKETINKIFNSNKIKWSTATIYYCVSIFILFIFHQSPNILKNHPYNNRNNNNDKKPK